MSAIDHDDARRIASGLGKTYQFAGDAETKLVFDAYLELADENYKLTSRLGEVVEESVSFEDDRIAAKAEVARLREAADALIAGIEDAALRFVPADRPDMARVLTERVARMRLVLANPESMGWLLLMLRRVIKSAGDHEKHINNESDEIMQQALKKPVRCIVCDLNECPEGCPTTTL